MEDNQDIAIVYMVAGLSSRFGGRVKQLVKVTDKHTLIEYSLEQALKSGFTKIIFIVGEKTEQYFKQIFGYEYKGLPVNYVFQTYDKEKRDRPWGTAATVVELKDKISCPFVICNGDDIYGENTFKILAGHLKENQETATVGYKLHTVLPDQGSVHRGILQHSEDNHLINLAEVFDIEKNNLEKTNSNPEDLCSMNIFAFHPETINHFHEKFILFQEQNKEDRKIEFLLPNIVGELIRENKIKMKVYPTSDKWIGITNPEDEEIVRQALKEIEDNSEDINNSNK